LIVYLFVCLFDCVLDNFKMPSFQIKGSKVKEELVSRAFRTIFPKAEFDWKNSQGLFNSLGLCATKRSLSYSLKSEQLGQDVLARDSRKMLTRGPALWALCGIGSTRANVADDTSFVLCKKIDGHYRGVAIIYVSVCPITISPTGFKVVDVNTSTSHVDSILDDMKKERVEYANEKKKQHSPKKRNRKPSDTGSERPLKRPRKSDPSEIEGSAIDVDTSFASEETFSVVSTSTTIPVPPPEQPVVDKKDTQYNSSETNTNASSLPRMESSTDNNNAPYEPYVPINTGYNYEPDNNHIELPQSINLEDDPLPFTRDVIPYDDYYYETIAKNDRTH